jgi:hypothetical protein
MQGEEVIDPDLHTWGEDTLAIVRDAEIDAEDEMPRCDFVLDPDRMGVSCDAPAPHCVGGTHYYCDEHRDCPEWGGEHRYEEQETWDHHIVIGCNCGHQPPREREEL